MSAPIPPVLAYAASCTVGGALVGLALASAALAVRSASSALMVALTLLAGSVAILAVICEWHGAVRPLPERARQVPRRWLLWRCRSCTAAAFGLMLGAGIYTHLLHAVAYVVAVLALLAPSPLVGMSVGAIYGGTRGAILLVTWAADRWNVRRPPWRRLASSGPTSHRGLAVLALAALIAAADVPALLG